MTRALFGSVAFALVATALGCAPKPDSYVYPAYHWVDTRTAIDDLRARAASVKTVSAECAITLTRADGETVQLDGALAMRNPGFVRLRAWKLNRAVFDLTLTPDGLWVMTLEDPKRRDQVLPASVNAADFVRQWSYFNGRLFELATPETAEVAGHTLILRPPRPVAEDGSGGSSGAAQLRCEVDRRSLTPRRYVYEDSARSFELKLEHYRPINGVMWPTRLVASGEMGSVRIDQRNVEINGELPDSAFTPPRRAEKRQ